MMKRAVKIHWLNLCIFHDFHIVTDLSSNMNTLCDNISQEPLNKPTWNWHHMYVPISNKQNQAIIYKISIKSKMQEIQAIHTSFISTY